MRGKAVGDVAIQDLTPIYHGVIHSTQTQYDSLGRPYRTQDASGRWLKSEFGPAGHLVAQCEWDTIDTSPACGTTSGTYLRLLEADARGQIELEQRGGSNSLMVFRSYYPETGRLERICSGAFSATTCSLQDEFYEWDEVGNLTSRNKVGQYHEHYEYDGLNRLRLATMSSVLGTPVAITSLQLNYDALGNPCSKTDLNSTLAYEYAGASNCGPAPTNNQASPHAATKVGGVAFQYDTFGNNTHRAAGNGQQARYLHYSAEQQAIEVGLGSATAPPLRTRFWYGPGGGRYKREDNGSGITGTRKTLYLGNVEIITEGGTTKIKRYLAGVAVQDIVNGAATTHYLFGDHLGSIVRVASATGIGLSGADFGPFGERRGYQDPRWSAFPPTQTNRGFTGHEMLDDLHDDLNIVHMNGRVYDNRIARFLQADPFVQEPANLQNHNRYTYLWNNPLNATDPSGMLGVKERQALATIIVIAAYATQNYWLGEVASKYAIVGYYTAVGAVSGGVATGSWKGALQGALTSMVMSAAGIQFANSDIWSRALEMGTISGTLTSLQGGKFGHGFLSAGAGVLVPGAVGKYVKGSTGQFIVSVLAGGTVSAATGGKFANGALAAALSQAIHEFSTSDVSHDDSRRLLPSMLKKWAGRLLIPDELKDPTVIAAIRQAWADALPHSYSHRHEEGGFWGFEEDGSYGVRRWPSGTRANIKVPPLEPGGIYQGLRVQGDFHIHPTPRPFDESGKRWHSAPSPGDFRDARKLALPGRSYIIDNQKVIWMTRFSTWGEVGTHREILGGSP